MQDFISGLISVIVPAYNVEKYIFRCLDSICNQTYRNLEILIVDDGSTDNCGQICERYAKRDDRIKVIHKENGGLSSARNVGLENATGEYIGFVDSDDWCENGMYERLVHALENGADIAVCGVRHDYEDRYTSISGFTNAFPGGKQFGSHDAVRELLLERYMTFASWNKLYKYKDISAMRFPVGKSSEDLWLVYNLLKESRVIINDGYADYHYFHRSGSITAGDSYSHARMDALYFAKEIEADVIAIYEDLREEANIMVMRFINALLWQIHLNGNLEEHHKDICTLKKELLARKDRILESTCIKDREKENILHWAHNDIWNMADNSNDNPDGKNSSNDKEKLFCFYEILCQWNQNKTLKRKSITDKLMQASFHKVIIYGCKELGELLYLELIDNGIDVVCFVDRNTDYYIGRAVYTPNQKLPDADCIIVSAVYYYDGIRKQLEAYTDIPIISLKNLVYDYQIV